MESHFEKTCFIIMPISDYAPYENGHFGRVYEHIIKPAVTRAGFMPLRADEVKRTNYIAIDILKRIINSEMCLCDLSSKNPNVLYELGIRQAFDLPVTFIKDSLTDRVFDIQGFRDVAYDEKMRVDNVTQNIESIAETIVNTYELKEDDEVNSLISLLGIEAAKIVKKEISVDTELILSHLTDIGLRINRIENQINSKTKAANAGKLSEVVIDNQNVFRLGEKLSNGEITLDKIVYHRKFGRGVVLGREGVEHNPIATIRFDEFGDKKLMLNYASLSSTIIQ